MCLSIHPSIHHLIWTYQSSTCEVSDPSRETSLSLASYSSSSSIEIPSCSQANREKHVLVLSRVFVWLYMSEKPPLWGLQVASSPDVQTSLACSPQSWWVASLLYDLNFLVKREPWRLPKHSSLLEFELLAPICLWIFCFILPLLLKKSLRYLNCSTWDNTSPQTQRTIFQLRTVVSELEMLILFPASSRPDCKLLEWDLKTSLQGIIYLWLKNHLILENLFSRFQSIS